MLLGSHWAGRVWTGRDEQRELQGLAIQARMVALGVVGGGEAYISPSSCRRRFWANSIPRFDECGLEAERWA